MVVFVRLYIDYKGLFYQDRLGANIGKALKKEYSITVFLKATRRRKTISAWLPLPPLTTCNDVFLEERRK